MGEAQDIMYQCKDHEKKYKEFGVNTNDPGRLINKGWIECSEFFLRNFDITEKQIKEKGE